MTKSSKYIKQERKLCGKCKLRGISWCCPYFDGMFFGHKLKHCGSFILSKKKIKEVEDEDIHS